MPGIGNCNCFHFLFCQRMHKPVEFNLHRARICVVGVLNKLQQRDKFVGDKLFSKHPDEISR